MKKTAAVVFVLLSCLFLFSGCNKPKKVPENMINNLTENFTCVFKTTIGETDYRVKFRKNAPGDYLISFLEPAELSKLSFGWKNERMDIEYGDMGFHINAENIPQSSFIKTVFLVMDNAVDKDNVTYLLTKDGAELYGHTVLGKFTVKTDKAFNPYEISIPEADLVFDLSDFEITD